jgi:hypothetical protein
VQQQYQTFPNPNIHTGSIPSTGRSSYTNFQAANNAIIVDKSVEDTRMIIEQSNRIMSKNGGDDMIVAMQQMFNNTNGAAAQNIKAIYQPQQIYFN